MSVVYGLLASITTWCVLCALAPGSSSLAKDAERLGAAFIAGIAVGVIVGLAT